MAMLMTAVTMSTMSTVSAMSAVTTMARSVPLRAFDSTNGTGQIEQLADQSTANGCQAGDHADSDEGQQQQILDEDRTFSLAAETAPFCNYPAHRVHHGVGI